MDEKQYIEMMVSESTDFDDGHIDTDEQRDEIARMIMGFNEVSNEEKVIIKKILEVLDKHELKYSYDEDEPKYICLEFGIEKKPFIIHIILQDGKVNYRLSFPFRVQTNAYLLMCLFMAEFNENKAFTQLALDSDDGELTMKYSYMLEDPDVFDEKCFWVCLTSFISPALEIYTKASHLSVGMVSEKDRKRYKKLLEMSLETVNGDFDNDSISYGID